MNEKIKRELWQTFIKPGTENAKYMVIGEDLEDFALEMNADIEKKKNILGTTSINLKGYEKQSTVAPYVCRKSDEVFTWLKGIVDNEKTLDDVKTTVCNVDLFETATAGAYPAIEEEVYVEVTSFGGDTEALKIEYNIHYTGIKRSGTFNPTTKTFTATGEAA